MSDFCVTVERSTGNERVGHMWTETAVFAETATLAQIAEWIDGPRWRDVPRLAHDGGCVRLTRVTR